MVDAKTEHNSKTDIFLTILKLDNSGFQISHVLLAWNATLHFHFTTLHFHLIGLHRNICNFKKIYKNVGTVGI